MAFNALQNEMVKKPGITNPGALSAFLSKKKLIKPKKLKSLPSKSMRGALGLNDGDGDEGLIGR